MKTSLYAGVTLCALTTVGAQADQINVAGPWLSPEAEIVREIFDVFEERSGHKVSYVGSDSFEQQIVVDAEAGSAPHIAVFPQPGLAADMASRGFLAPLKPQVTEGVKNNYSLGSIWPPMPVPTAAANTTACSFGSI